MKTLSNLLNKKNRTPAQVVIQDVLAVKKDERVLIIANPATNEIAQDLAEATGRSISTSETQDSKPKSDSSDDIPNKADEINVF